MHLTASNTPIHTATWALGPDNHDLVEKGVNNVEPSICFTVVVDSEGKLLFLDVLLWHGPDSSIWTTVYQSQCTQTGMYLVFTSHPPHPTHKIAVVRLLHSRAEAINSSVLPRIKRLDTSGRPSLAMATLKVLYATRYWWTPCRKVDQGDT